VPLALLIAFLIGFLPTWLIMRARLWSVRRRLEGQDRQRATVGAPAAEVPVDEPMEPVI
jgi:hypothetical protein